MSRPCIFLHLLTSQVCLCPAAPLGPLDLQLLLTITDAALKKDRGTVSRLWKFLANSFVWFGCLNQSAASAYSVYECTAKRDFVHLEVN